MHHWSHWSFRDQADFIHESGKIDPVYIKSLCEDFHLSQMSPCQQWYYFCEVCVYVKYSMTVNPLLFNCKYSVFALPVLTNGQVCTSLQIFAYLYICIQSRTLFLDIILHRTGRNLNPNCEICLKWRHSIHIKAPKCRCHGFFFQDSKHPAILWITVGSGVPLKKSVLLGGGGVSGFAF